MPVEIDSDIDTERWRWECPNGHPDWWATSSTTIWCGKCKREGYDDSHNSLVDKRTGDAVPVSKLSIRGYRGR